MKTTTAKELKARKYTDIDNVITIYGSKVYGRSITRPQLEYMLSLGVDVKKATMSQYMKHISGVDASFAIQQAKAGKVVKIEF